MKTKMKYPFQEEIPFILFTCLFWVLIIPIPITIYLIMKRLERKQLCRLLIAKIYNINYYMEEISEMKGEEPEKFVIDLDVTELSFQDLSKRQEELRREYDILVFNEILEEKIERSRATEKSEGQDEKTVHEILEGVNVESAMKEVAVEQLLFERENKGKMEQEQEIGHVKDNRIIIDADDWGDGEF